MIDLIPFIFIVATLAVVSVLSDKVRIPYPILLVLVGLVIGFIPGLPLVELDPEVVFLLFLPPLLFRAGWNTSWPAFRAAIRPISRLSIGLVFLTTCAVAVAAHYFIPGMRWPVAFVLGAIVSPPDAVSATSIMKGTGLDKRVITILEGESLVNDASALIAYKYAVAAVASSTFVLWKAGVQFLVVAAGGILVGTAVGYGFAYMMKRVRSNAMLEGTMSLLVPFISYPVAEAVGVSGVLAVVSTGLVTSWLSHEMFSHQGRTLVTSVWDMIEFLLNGAVFVLIGFQLSTIVHNTVEYSFADLIGYGLIVSAVVVVVRLLFIVPTAYFTDMLSTGEYRQRESGFDWKVAIVLSWTGMRGVVSLATAMAIPLVMENGKHFPYRKLILFVSFVVILVTLIGQGLSLPYLIRKLGIRSSGQEEAEEETRLRLLLANSSLDFIHDHFSQTKMNPDVADQVRKLYELRSNWIKDKKYGTNQQSPGTADLLSQVVDAQLTVTQFKRDLLLRLHREASFSESAIRKMERELDLDEARLRSHV